MRRGLMCWVLLLAGLVCFGFGIALMVVADLGLGPWEVLHQGISRNTGLAIGTVSILTSVPVLLLWLPLGERPGIGTVINVFLIGIVTNVSLDLLPHPTSMISKVVCMLAGVLIIGLGSGMYLSSRMGAGPRDGLMLGFSRRTGHNVALVRTAIEVSVLIIGMLLGGTFGIGTLVFAFGIGPVVQVALRVFTETPLAPRCAAEASRSA